MLTENIKTVCVLVFISAAAVFLLSSCSSREVFLQQEKITRQVLLDNPDMQHSYLMVDGHTLHYIINGDRHKPALVIIHGTPGDWRQYSRYLFNSDLLSLYQVIVIDRPGWGESRLAGDKSYADFSLQALIIAPLLKQLKNGNNDAAVVLMGHSLGASLAPQIALDFPQLTDGLLLFAGTLDPALSKPRWFNYVARVPFSNWLIGEELHRANQEIFALEENIALMSTRWLEINAMMIVVQGMNDELVYPSNVDYAARELNPLLTTTVRLESEGHLFPMTRPNDVITWAADVLIKIQQRKIN
ncbi:MAG: pimeloyl-ACP methyl ester carboxylesterase [Granulosicoccus sp.]|jgi:pimeloyl-ACP methyl ester carboxylesterase